ncbi:DUF5317 family protein [Clostridium sp. YIM B02505]|uniref:DUF5317 family protein n=1 Tax=Clostridium yunnanense TaxID=2800325 RepID=A0ABS1EK55_9CLOT|nr:DUF5317 family protein [Clostridium yunnanense]MBK1809747.1 DUF5317 family protein [Clostridium yunnanense]
MIETILLAVLVAKIRGYKIKPLFTSWDLYPTFSFVILYLLLNIQVFLGNYSFIKYSGILESVYICTFLIPIIRHKLYTSALIGSIAIMIGTLLNKKAISANNGKMPVFPTLSYITGYVNGDVFIKAQDIHILGSKSSRLKVLTDVIDLGYSILSIGDIFIRIFIFIIVFNIIKNINENKI